MSHFSRSQPNPPGSCPSSDRCEYLEVRREGVRADSKRTVVALARTAVRDGACFELAGLIDEVTYYHGSRER